MIFFGLEMSNLNATIYKYYAKNYDLGNIQLKFSNILS